MPAISDNVGMDIETSYDLIKVFHQRKPVNPVLGVKLPTVVNGSWGYQTLLVTVLLYLGSLRTILVPIIMPS